MMNRILVEQGFRLTMPKQLRTKMKVGDEMYVGLDRAGRIIIISEKRVRAALNHTAGLWRGRKDIPNDGVKYTNRLRKGRRLLCLGVTPRATS